MALTMREVWLNRIALCGLVGVVLGGLSASTYVDIDVFHQMALFREALARGRIPTEDIFSYVPTVTPVIHHEWGTGALLYFIAVSSGLGATGLMIAKYLLSAAVVFGCYEYAKREGASIAVFAPLALVAMGLAGIGFTTIRAHVFTLLFMVILLLFLQLDRCGKRWWIGVWLPLHLLWINLHAGFVVSLGLITLYASERFLVGIMDRKPLPIALWQIKHLIAVALAMVLMIMLNPYGFDYIRYLWHGLLLDRSAYITEWRPIWDSTHGSARAYGIPLLTVYVMILVYSVFKLKLRDMPNIFFLLLTAWLSIMHIRYLSILAVAWTCCAPAYIEKTKAGEMLRTFWMKRKRFLLVFWITCGILGLSIASWQRFWHLRIPTTLAEQEKTGGPLYPVGAVEYLADQRFEGNMMVPFSVGAYVSWKLYPDVKVSCDSRFEAAYPVEWAKEQTRFYRGKEGWKETLNRYPTDAVLVPGDSPINELLEQAATKSMATDAVEWRRVYTDDGFSVFVRSEIAKNLPCVDNRGKLLRAGFP